MTVFSLIRVLWPSPKKKMIFFFLVTTITSGNASLLNDVNVSGYCSLEIHLSLFHPQARVSCLLEGIWISHQQELSVPNHADVQDLFNPLLLEDWTAVTSQYGDICAGQDLGIPMKTRADHRMGTSVPWGHLCHGDICTGHRGGRSVSLYTRWGSDPHPYALVVTGQHKTWVLRAVYLPTGKPFNISGNYGFLFV